LQLDKKIMRATDFIKNANDPQAWLKHSKALRHSASVLWEEFAAATFKAAKLEEAASRAQMERAQEILETSKLMYGLALETALKAWIIEHAPEKIEVRVSMHGDGVATHAEIRTLGVPTSSGHNLLALAEVAGLFGDQFSTVLVNDSDRKVFKNICRDLGEVVVWRGRYPIPLSSYDPIQFDRSVPLVALAHYMRDFLDPVLNALLNDTSSSEFNLDRVLARCV
jgi:hypothetical protein